MNNTLPYKVIYSTGDECCQKCTKPIQPNRLQMAIMKQSNDDDFRFAEWYHMKCFFKTCLPQTEAAFDGFAKLRYTDQLAIKVHLGTLETESKNEKNATNLPEFSIEYSKNGLHSCATCQQKFKKCEIRIVNTVYDSNQNSQPKWYHAICFAGVRTKLGWLQGAVSLSGFDRLSEEDKNVVANQIPLISLQLNQSIFESRTNPNHVDLEELIETQNKEYYELFDKLAENVSDEDQIKILKANKQMMPIDKIERLHHLTDVIYFGALKPCPNCKSNELIFVNSTYMCTHVTAWSTCGIDVKEPQRGKTTISNPLRAKYPFLIVVQSVRTRVLHSFRLTDESGQDLISTPYKHPPLFNMEFVLVGKLRMSPYEIEGAIKKMGGRVVSVIHDKLTAVISNPEEVQKMGFQMIQAKKYMIQVISDEFLTEVTTTDPMLYIISKSLVDWGGDPYARTEPSDVISKRASFYTKSLPEKVTYKWKDGGAVDPECGLEDNAHVYRQTIDRRQINSSVVLGLVDIEKNKNCYYRIQLLESNDQKLFWIFEAWGRVSTVIGSKRLTNYGNEKEAIEKFNALYKEKTANNFGNWTSPKRPGKYYHLDIEFSPARSKINTNIPTKLSPPVYQLMEMLFNLKHIESTMVSFDLDLKQMPLGKISLSQITSAMSVLQTMEKLISPTPSGTKTRKMATTTTTTTTAAITTAKLREASNKFYTLIPHSFGVNRPTVIDSIQTVQEKYDLLQSLLDMDLIYDLLDGNSDKINPLDACYQKLSLKADIQPIDKLTAEFGTLCEVVRNTHGVTHDKYTLEVQEVFKVRREGEDDRFKAFEGLENHLLLWHGSRLMNYVSILSSGLKIAPPEAPVTGYMFGKGIYFADVVSKSANYCHDQLNNNVGLMLLCEVALGKSQDLFAANSNITGIPNENHQSIRACGALVPIQWMVIDGVPCAQDKVIRTAYQTALHYNEYVVYNPAQVRIKYLIKMKFNHKK